jgi:hypothetical protein
MDAFRSLSILDGCGWRKPPAPSSDAFEHKPVGLRVILIDFSPLANLRSTRQRKRRVGFGECLTTGNSWRLVASRRPPPTNNPLHTSRLRVANDQRRLATLRSFDKPPLHRPSRKPDRHDARHATPSFL